MANTDIKAGDTVLINCDGDGNGAHVGTVQYVTDYWIGILIAGERGVHEWHPCQVRRAA